MVPVKGLKPPLTLQELFCSEMLDHQEGNEWLEQLKRRTFALLSPTQGTALPLQLLAFLKKGIQTVSGRSVEI